MFDETVGRTVCALEKSGLGENSLVVVTSDNGGWVKVEGSNFPYRGSKGSMVQGSVRTFAFLHGSVIPSAARGTTCDGLVHISDWFPTLLGLASKGSWNVPANGKEIDGVDVFNAIVSGSASPRTEIFHNFNSNTGVGSMQIGQYKLIIGDTAPTLGTKASFFTPVMNINEVCSLEARQLNPTVIPTTVPVLSPSHAPTQALAPFPTTFPTTPKPTFEPTPTPKPMPQTPQPLALLPQSYSLSFSYSSFSIT